MIIGIDAREIQDGVYTGIGRVLYDFLRYSETALAADTIVLFTAKPLPFTFSPGIRVHVMPQQLTLWWDQVQLPVALHRAKVDVFYSPYYKVPLMARCIKVAAVLDLIYICCRESRQNTPWAKRVWYRVAGRMFAHAADRILTCSSFSAEEIIRVHGVGRKKISIIPLAVSTVYRPGADPQDITAMKEKFHIPGPYILYAGNFKPHKNVGALMDAFALLRAGHPGLYLVLVGPKAAGFPGLLAKSRMAGIEDRVIFTDAVKDETTSRLLYAGAQVFVMPSLYEGFGLPPVEAMACGTPVVCSGASSLPEVAGDAAVMVDARDPAQIARAVNNILSYDALKRACVEKGLLQAGKFRQDVVMGRVLAFFREAGQ